MIQLYAVLAFATQMTRIGAIVFYVFLMCDSIPETMREKAYRMVEGKVRADSIVHRK